MLLKIGQFRNGFVNKQTNKQTFFFCFLFDTNSIINPRFFFKVIDFV